MSTVDQTLSTGIWRSLVWKGVRQLLPLHVALFGIGGLMVLLNRAIMDSLNYDYFTVESWYFAWYMISIVSSILCATVIFGQERESRTWQWTSSLPVTWRTTLACNLSLAFLFAVVFALLGWFIFALTGEYFGNRFPLGPNSLLLGLLWIQSFSLVGLAILVIDETFWGLVVGAALTVALQAVMPVATDNQLPGHSFVVANSKLLFWPILLSAGVQIVLLALLTIAHAWRWRSGTHVNLLESLRSWKTGLSEESVVSWPAVAAGASPGALSSLVWNSFRQYRWMRWAIAAYSLVTLFDVWSIARGATGSDSWTRVATFEVTALLAGILGISAFAGDRARDRVKFLSHRGVSPIRFWLSRMVWPGAIVGLLALGVFLIPNTSDRFPAAGTHFWLESLVSMTNAMTVIGVYMICQLCGICFRSILIVIFAACGSLFLLFFTWIAGRELLPLFRSPTDAGVISGLGLGIGLCLAVSPIFCGRWFRWERAGLARRFVSFVVATSAMGFALSIVSAFYAIPYVAWRGLDESELPTAVERLGLRSDPGSAHLDFHAVGIDDQLVSRIIDHNEETLLAAGHPTHYSINRGMIMGESARLTTAQLISEFLDTVGKQIDSADPQALVMCTQNVRELSELNNDICQCLEFAVSGKDHALAVRCLELVVRLRTSDFSRVILGAPVTPVSLPGVDLESMIDEELVTAAGGPDEFRELIRPLYLDAQQGRQVLIDVMSVLRDGDYELRHLIYKWDLKFPHFVVPDWDVEEKWMSRRSLSVRLDCGLASIALAEYSRNLFTAKLEGRSEPQYPEELKQTYSRNFHDRYQLATRSFYVAKRLEQVVSCSVQHWEYSVHAKLKAISAKLESGEIKQEPDSNE